MLQLVIIVVSSKGTNESLVHDASVIFGVCNRLVTVFYKAHQVGDRELTH